MRRFRTHDSLKASAAFHRRHHAPVTPASIRAALVLMLAGW